MKGERMFCVKYVAREQAPVFVKALAFTKLSKAAQTMPPVVSRHGMLWMYRTFLAHAM